MTPPAPDKKVPDKKEGAGAQTPTAALHRAAISVRGVSKAYAIYDKPANILSEVLFGRKNHRDKLILQDINIEIEPGEVVGVIGKNGAGKSTLLKLIAGTLSPTSGKVDVKGRVSAILELGTGFNPAYSGRDNVIMSALMRGMSESAIRAKFDQVVAFAGLEDVIDQPFITYSSGMQARLAFAAAVAVDADVIIIDEALAAGDIRFTARSLRRVREICESGVTALFVSHQTYHVMQLCSRAIWIDDGRIRMDGPPIDVCRAYEYEMHAAIAKDEGRLATNVTVLAPPPAPELPVEAPLELAVEGAIELPVEAAVEVLPAETAKPEIEAAETSAPEPELELLPVQVTEQVPAPSVADPEPPENLIEAPLVPVETTDGASTISQSSPKAPTPLPQSSPAEVTQPAHFQSNQYRVTKLEFLDRNGNETRVFRFGEPFRMRVAYECLLDQVPEFSCGLAAALTSTPEHLAVMYFNTNYPHSDAEMVDYDAASFRQHKGRTGVVEAHIPILQVRPGNYLISFGILPNRPDFHEFYEYHHLAHSLTILANGYPEPSVFYAQVEWTNGPAPISDAKSRA